MNGKELDAALEAAGGNLTEAIRRELAANGNTAAARAADGFGFWLAAWIPDADEATKEARERGMIFGPDARRLVAGYFEEARRCFDALTHGDGEPLDIEAFAKVQRESEEATALAVRCRERVCAALQELARTKGEAAKLARGAIADFLNCLAADDTAAAVQAAFDHANEAARAYFIEQTEAQKAQGKPKTRKAVTHKAAAVLCEVSRQTVINWERGRNTPDGWPGRDSWDMLKVFADRYRANKGANRLIGSRFVPYNEGYKPHNPST